MTVLATDNFNRADAANLGANWTTGSGSSGTLPIVSNQVGKPAGGIDWAYNNTVTWPANQNAQLTLATVCNTTDEGLGPALRITGTSTLYLSQFNTAETRLYRCVGGVFTQLGSDGPPGATSDIAYAEVQGTTLIVKKNGTTIIGPITDSAIATGNAGIWETAGGTAATSGDDWAGGDFSVISNAIAPLLATWIRTTGKGPIGPLAMAMRLAGTRPHLPRASATTFTQNLAGALSSSGALANLTSKSLSGALSIVGTLAKLTGKPLAGSITPTGLAQKQTQSPKGGTLTSSGAATKAVAKNTAGALTSSGVAAKSISKPFAGGLTPSGALALLKVSLLALGGTLSSSGTLAKSTLKGLAGTLTSSGALAKLIGKKLAGALTSSGALSALKVALLSLGGSLSSSGALKKSTSKALTGAISPSGALAKLAAKLLAGVVSSAGALARLTSKGLSGVLTSSGRLGKLIGKALAGIIAAAGALATSGGTQLFTPKLYPPGQFIADDVSPAFVADDVSPQFVAD